MYWSQSLIARYIGVGSGQPVRQTMGFILHASLLLEQACFVSPALNTPGCMPEICVASSFARACNGGKPLFVNSMTLTSLLSELKAFISPCGAGVSLYHQVNVDTWLFPVKDFLWLALGCRYG